MRREPSQPWLFQASSISLLLALLAWPQPGYAQAGTPANLRLDLTANGVVDSADAVMAASVWSDLATDSSCGQGSATDLNGDGCVDVADVQLLAATLNAPAHMLPSASVASDEAAIWTVRSNGDEPDSNPGDGVCRTASGPCTLRAALAEANRSASPDRIEFNIRGRNGSCPSRVFIAPDSVTQGMLILDDPRGAGTVIDGYTQCGAQPNSGAVSGNAVIKIELYGRLDRLTHGLQILSPNNVVRGLAIYNWDRQIEIEGGRAHHNQIEGNFIGTNIVQSFSSQSLSTHHSEGVRIHIGATYNIVGCGAFDAENRFLPCDEAAAAAGRNVVSGNGNDGIHVEGTTYYNRIVGNYVGLKQDGVTALANRTDGVDFEKRVQHNWLGGPTPAERNVISGNGSEGIEISHDTATKFNYVVGNYFGLDASGTKAVGNAGNGVSFEDTVDQNYAYENVVSGNKQSGFRFYVMNTRNEVRRNLVGVAADGVTPLPNRLYGVHVMGGSQFNLVTENLIAHNLNHGIYLASTSNEEYNFIGTTYFNTLSRNRVFLNGGAGIVFYGLRGLIPNENLARPTLLRANAQRVAGTTCPGCLVELFLADSSDQGELGGEGMQFIGEARADAAGDFVATIAEAPLGQFLTGTATDSSGNTSPFARSIAVTDVVIDPPPTTPTPPTETPPTELTPETSGTPSAIPTGPTATPTPGPADAPRHGVWLPLIAK